MRSCSKHTQWRKLLGYPPDLEDAAIRTVVLQAEVLAAEVAG
jgi:hypothetical protein